MGSTVNLCVFLIVGGLFLPHFIKEGSCQPRTGPHQRIAPLCIHPTDPVFSRDVQNKFSDFLPIINDTDRFWHNVTLFRREDPRRAARPPLDDLSILDWIEFLPVEVDFDSIPNNTLVEQNRIMGGGSVMNQWIHLQIRLKGNIEGLIVQAIHGPLGIPFGSFVGVHGNEGKMVTRCPCMGSAQTQHLNYLTVPCSYKSRASLTHPNIYVWHNGFRYGNRKDFKEEYTSLPRRDEFRLHFSFVDVICYRAAAIQFLVIAVRSFAGANGQPDAEAAFTPTFIRGSPSSADGAPYPVHPDFCGALTCDVTKTYFPNDFGEPWNIRYSYEYDLCILRTDPSATTRVSCPPGPFNCNMTTLAFQPEADMYRQFTIDPDCGCQRDRDADAIGRETPPIFRAPVTPSWVDDFEEIARTDGITPSPIRQLRNRTIEELHKLAAEILAELKGIVTGSSIYRTLHGLFMLLAFSVTCSISIFLSRFDKDTFIGVGCCGKGMWLWGHILFSIFSGSIMWAGIFILILADLSEEEKFVRTAGTVARIAVHMLVGFIAVFLFFFVFFTGWVRPVGRRFRYLYMKVHAIVGYASKVCAVIAMIEYLGGARHIGLFPLFVLVPEGLTLIFYAVSTIVQRLTDSHMELKTKRGICPYVEHKELSKPIPGSCGMIRNVLFVLHLSGLVAIFGVFVVLWPYPKPRSYYDLIVPGNWGIRRRSTTLATT